MWGSQFIGQRGHMQGTRAVIEQEINVKVLKTTTVHVTSYYSHTHQALLISPRPAKKESEEFTTSLS